MTYDNKNIEIKVNTFMNLECLSFSFLNDNNPTITSLKNEIKKIMNVSIHEQKIMIGENYPYPLNDDLQLSDLLPEHRTLNLFISENPKKCVPKRLLNNRKLNLEKIIESDLEYIHNWIFIGYRSIEIYCEHPLFTNILENIEESIECSLYDKPVDIRTIIFYQYDYNKHYISIFENFNKIKNYKSYKLLKLIDESTNTEICL